MARQMGPGQFGGMFDPALQQVLTAAFQSVGADEGTVWIADPEEEYLHPIYNSGPHATQLVGVYKQPLQEGIISMVYANQQAFLENDVGRNSRHSKRVDALLGKRTEAMMAVPLQVCGQGKGVISCVQLNEQTSSAPTRHFKSELLVIVQRAADVIGRCIDHGLISRAIGWSNH